jgi:hypothetical protein
MKRKTYRSPRNATERVAEAKAAIRRLEASAKLMIGTQAWYAHRDAIARWQQVIDQEAK